MEEEISNINCDAAHNRRGFPDGSALKNLSAMQETSVRSQGQEDPLEKEMVTHSSILAWESHGQRSLADYSPWSHIELDRTEQARRPGQGGRALDVMAANTS